MKKDFNGSGWAKSHRSEFEELIANARRKRESPVAKVEENGEGKEGVRKKEVTGEQGAEADGDTGDGDSKPRRPVPSHEGDITTTLPQSPSNHQLPSHSPPQPPAPSNPASTTPGFNLAASLGPTPAATPVNDATNATATLATTLDSFANDVPASTKIWRAEGPIRRKPMFDMPGDPVVDAEMGGSADGDGGAR